jgi:hypothetical protein
MGGDVPATLSFIGSRKTHGWQRARDVIFLLEAEKRMGGNVPATLSFIGSRKTHGWQRARDIIFYWKQKNAWVATCPRHYLLLEVEKRMGGNVRATFRAFATDRSFIPGANYHLLRNNRHFIVNQGCQMVYFKKPKNSTLGKF